MSSSDEQSNGPSRFISLKQQVSILSFHFRINGPCMTIVDTACDHLGVPCEDPLHSRAAVCYDILYAAWPKKDEPRPQPTTPDAFDQPLDTTLRATASQRSSSLTWQWEAPRDNNRDHYIPPHSMLECVRPIMDVEFRTSCGKGRGSATRFELCARGSSKEARKIFPVGRADSFRREHHRRSSYDISIERPPSSRRSKGIDSGIDVARPESTHDNQSISC
jgi:hypothetical protein